jgi:hypothetical protein
MADDIQLSRWRVGVESERAIYLQCGPEPADEDRLIGFMDTGILSKIVVDVVNRALAQE